MIEFDELRVERDGVTLLPAVSARVAAGTALVLRGDNGTGKSTLLRVLAGLETATDGRVAVAGETPALRDPAFRRHVSALVGTPPLADDLTLAEHLELVAETWREPVAGSASSPRAVLAELDIESLAQRFPHTLSSGQQQLFLLSLALVRPFDVLLVDEPEQRLDLARTRLMVEVLRARLDAGAALVVATHSDLVEGGLGGRVLDLDEQATA